MLLWRWAEHMEKRGSHILGTHWLGQISGPMNCWGRSQHVREDQFYLSHHSSREPPRISTSLRKYESPKCTASILSHVNARWRKPIQTFCKSLFEPNWGHAQKQDLNGLRKCPREWQVCNSFYTLRIKEENVKEGYMKSIVGRLRKPEKAKLRNL